MKTKATSNRNLAAITSELQVAMQTETTSIIAIGGLLLEAKDQLEHGEWLGWLERNFERSTRTAYNYMSAARAAAKLATIANLGTLKLRQSALYAIGDKLDTEEIHRKWQIDAPPCLHDDATIAAILKAAETEWITANRANEIAEEIEQLRQPPDPPPQSDEEIAAEEAAEEAEMTAQRATQAARQAELDAILDGPPPDNPPTPEATRDVVLPPFDQAISTLKHLSTKPLDKFIGSEHSAHDLAPTGDFLHDVADAIDKQKCGVRGPQGTRGAPSGSIK
jgi:hypothetical protein